MMALGAGSMSRGQIMRQLKATTVDNVSIAKDLSNVIARSKKMAVGTLTNTEAAVERLSDLGWKYKFRMDADNNVTDFVFMPPDGLTTFQDFPSTLFMDCTYRTNKAKLPLLQVVGMTNTETASTFALGFALLSSEKQDSYTWALQWMATCIDESDKKLESGGPGINTRQKLQTVITDCETALMNAIEETLPHTKIILCIWHINKNVEDRLRKTVGQFVKSIALHEGKDYHPGDILVTTSQIRKKWYSIVYASTEEEFINAVKSLCSSAPSAFMEYIEQQWLPHKQRFVAFWVDQFCHFGQKASSRVEGAHAKLKNDPSLRNSSLGNVLTVVNTCILVVEDYKRETRHALENDKRFTLPRFQTEPFYRHVVRAKNANLVAIKAMKLVGYNPAL